MHRKKKRKTDQYQINVTASVTINK